MNAWKIVLAAFALAWAGAAFAQADEVAHPDARVEKRLKDLGEELRCLVCQNQTIADSSAPLALDLRNEIRQLVKQGQSDDQIRAYLVQRYGDFVLYKPPLKPTTILLWIGPFALLAGGIGVWLAMMRRRRTGHERHAAPTQEKRAAIAALLEEEPARVPPPRRKR